MTYRTWDTETTIRTSFKRKANPFDPSNWVVTHGYSAAGGGVVEEHRFGRHRPGPGWLKPVLADINLLIGMNIKFDVLHAIANDDENLKAWMKFVVRGGRVWDIQLAEYLLNGMAPSSHMLSLDEIAPRYAGTNLKIDEVKKLWEAGISTEDIDPELLSRYLVGGLDETGRMQIGDVGNTEVIALQQIKRAKANGQAASILLNMGGLMFTIEAERNGMFVDKAMGLAIAEKLEVTLKELRVQLDAYLPAMPAEMEWKWSSRKKLSALIFGGSIRYDGKHYVHEDGTSTLVSDWDKTDGKPLTYYLKTEKQLLLADGTTTTKTPQEQLELAFGGSPEPVQYKAGLNKGEFKYKNVTGPDIERGPKTRIGDGFFLFPRMTDPSPLWETSEPGVYSVGEEIMEALGNRNIPFLKALSKLSSLQKDLGTYYITTDDEGNQKGMLTLVGIDGLIHHMLNMTSTVTARLSSSNPNLQNLSNGNKSEVKTIFVSRFKDGKIIQSDFRSLEVYVQAILTLSKQLIADLQAGLDMHVLRLSQKEGKPYEEVLALAKGPDATQEWKDKRTGSKEFSFQAAYGAGDQAISDTTGIAIETVAELRAADEKRYPEVGKFYDKMEAEVNGNARPTGAWTPHPDKPSVMVQLRSSTYRTPDGKVYSFRSNPSPSYLLKRGILDSFSPTERKNYPVQGMGGEWAKAAMYLVLVEFYRRENFGGLALLVNQVHDAIYGDADRTVADEAAAVIHAAMEAASDYMEYLFGWPIPLPVPTETEHGSSMADHHEVPGLTERAALIRTEIRASQMQGYVPTYERT